jgi:hypothetical protein
MEFAAKIGFVQCKLHLLHLFCVIVRYILLVMHFDSFVSFLLPVVISGLYIGLAS